MEPITTANQQVVETPSSGHAGATPVTNQAKPKMNNGVLAKELEIERVRNRFISHEVKKMDRNQSRINAPQRSTSDTESESDSEFFLKKPTNSTTTTHYHIRPTVRVSDNNNTKIGTTQVAQPQLQAQVTKPVVATPVATGRGTTASLPREAGLYALRPSLLSSESTGASYRGFFNLMVLLLILTSFRLVILNHLTYGIRIDLGLLQISEWHRWPGLVIALSMNIYILLAYFVEKGAANKMLPPSFFVMMRIINCTGLITIPTASIVYLTPNPVSGIIVMITVCILSMKIVSYHYENNKQRHLHPDNKKFDGVTDPEQYPNNITLTNIYWYMFVPTLVYQLSYPRSPRIRKLFMLRRIIEAVFLSALIFWMVEQYMVPLVENSVKPMEQYDFVRIVERVMKLSLPNLYVWLLGFYVFFHLYLNICAELTRFGDREFYRDWWNSTGLDYFWRTWNMPVHHWMVVIIYTPMRRRGWSKHWGYFMCFFVSAVFHELVISVPFQTIKLWGFLGIASQMILIVLTKNLMNGKTIGNVVFWFSIVLGQPLIVLLYYRNFIVEHPHLYPKISGVLSESN
ncbi:hypothetical protein SAMD00019534_065880 [Acytostelium subglobosum LB1]|uniref:hypothetical protein n=1 Tax=Acytostelium subglobosum LB1 TaxID=1410327 RepID=UPI000644820A|nr:hypothetical protein SAMD00019534_065880 [Acytostelium subglobosum LB1]GAM23413.1 hypothetical protein SAMD00019534_065880 [Acytostelium subglobosum LB1]|eukprot:XP_012753862.1 hypothetical protein SAMD00019534_065880 [Acytostelium subglobosum LB1]